MNWQSRERHPQEFHMKYTKWNVHCTLIEFKLPLIFTNEGNNDSISFIWVNFGAKNVERNLSIY